MQQQITIADILREYGDSYISRYNITGQQKAKTSFLLTGKRMHCSE